MPGGPGEKKQELPSSGLLHSLMHVDFDPVSFPQVHIVMPRFVAAFNFIPILGLSG